MLDRVVEGRLARAAALAAIVVMVSSCAAIRPTVTSSPDPTPLPSPTPTTALAINAVTPHVGEVGVDYSPITLGATGGTGAYQWSVSAGALPSGLDLSSDGHITGNPTSAGSFAFVIHVADAGDSTAERPTSIRVAPALVASLISACVSACTAELGCATACGPFGQVSGGLAPYTYRLTGGPLPRGTTLSGMTLKGTFTGLPGFVQFTVEVSDKLGATASVSPTFHIYPHVALANGDCTQSYATCTVRLPYTGGVGGTPTVKVGSWVCQNPCNAIYPPTGSCPSPAISISVGGGYVTVDLGGPNEYPHPIGTYTLVLVDQGICGPGGARCTDSATIAVDLYSAG